MNREIEFRAWDGKRMLCPVLLTLDEEAVFDTSLGEETLAKVISVMQYTSLKDKNGVEIYSGDLVRWGEHGKTAPVTWDEGYGYWGWDGDCLGAIIRANPDKAEVIGNVHQHPHLLTND